MRPNDIFGHLHKRPFQPIRVSAADGSYYDVRHPELMLVSKTEVVIGLKARNGGIPKRNAYIDPIHVTGSNRSTENGRSKSRFGVSTREKRRFRQSNLLAPPVPTRCFAAGGHVL